MTNALNPLAFDLDGTVQQLVHQYGAAAVKESVAKAAKAKRGRKALPDWNELREFLDRDVAVWLAGGDPIAERSNYAIANEFVAKSPGHSPASTHRRITRKLAAKPYPRKVMVLLQALALARDAHPHGVYLRTLRELITETGTDIWATLLEQAEETIAEYKRRVDVDPLPEMTMPEIEKVTRNALLPLLSRPQRRGMFGGFGAGLAG